MKYKFLAYIPVMAAALLSFSSCSEDFLDREPDGNYITTDQLEKAAKWNPKVLLGQTQGVTTSLIRWHAGGTDSQSDFGQKSVDISTDIIAHDIVFSNGTGSRYGYFREEAQGKATDKTSTSTDWYFYYKVIDACNFTLSTLGSDEVEPENPQYKLYYAEAKAARAYAYYNLVTLFTSGDYATNKDQKVLPIYRTQSSEAHGPEPTSKVYDLILTDLEDALVAFAGAASASDGQYVPSIDQPSPAVVHTLMAYTYLQMGKYTEAKQSADNAILISKAAGKKILTVDDLNYGFNTVNNDNWLWGVDITADNTGGLCTFWGMMDYYTYGYTYAGDFKSINSTLYNQIPANDARRGWFHPSVLLPLGKFHSAVSTSAGGDRSWESDIHFMRVEEPYLIAAEAEARMGNAQGAAYYLKPILNNRYEDATDDEGNVTETAAQQVNELLANKTAAEMLDEIFFNWRVEMWGEGKSLQTFKRFKKDIVCPANDKYGQLGTITAGSKSLIFAIPLQELNYNPLMKDANQ